MDTYVETRPKKVVRMTLEIGVEPPYMDPAGIYVGRTVSITGGGQTYDWRVVDVELASLEGYCDVYSRNNLDATWIRMFACLPAPNADRIVQKLEAQGLLAKTEMVKTIHWLTR